KEALKGTDIEAIKTAKEELQKAFYDIAGRIYQEQGAAAEGAGQADVSGAGSSGDDSGADNVVDADYQE
ncbi:MAG: molecular chaperone DnaK, partial [Oscillospiraceae bacterium]|nr:molecular chaperone DnaK [Oscillospiraceae bacterium]